MTTLHKQAFRGLFQLIIMLATAIFLPAWTLNYWQAWVFLVVFGISVLIITLYLMKNDTALLERRMSMGAASEKEKAQKIIQSLAGIAFIALFVVSSIDHRLGWSFVPMGVTVIGDIFVAIGLLIVFFVFRENSFASGIIEVGPTQTVISTGPYARVRHPMYTGAFIMLAGVPPALGSWWGLVAVVPLILAIIWRLFDEEKFLMQNLPGYVAYQNTVRYRLVPFIW